MIAYRFLTEVQYRKEFAFSYCQLSVIASFFMEPKCADSDYWCTYDHSTQPL